MIYANNWDITLPNKSFHSVNDQKIQKDIVDLNKNNPVHLGTFEEDGTYIPVEQIPYDPTGPIPFPKGGIDLDDNAAILSYDIFSSNSLEQKINDSVYLLICDELPENPFQSLVFYIDSIEPTLKIGPNCPTHITAKVTVPLYSILKFNITSSMTNDLPVFCETVDINPLNVSSINLKIEIPKIKSNMSSLSCLITMTKKIEYF